ncbi:hypothetical protein HOY80DRAFT_1030673 [Tuber brumale]|nr:hypothetical protein HOY80DRAFT_1030673 [Tuber brumale]
MRLDSLLELQNPPHSASQDPATGTHLRDTPTCLLDERLFRPPQGPALTTRYHPPSFQPYPQQYSKTARKDLLYARQQQGEPQFLAALTLTRDIALTKAKSAGDEHEGPRDAWAMGSLLHPRNREDSTIQPEITKVVRRKILLGFYAQLRREDGGAEEGADVKALVHG